MKLIRAIYKFFDKRVIVPITKLFVNLGNNEFLVTLIERLVNRDH